jgi:hypothetical protein
MISWTPVPGAIRFTLFDLMGRQLYSWECEGRQGAFPLIAKARREAHSAHVLQIMHTFGRGSSVKENIVLPR